ncbi:hypothetical protein GGX14DRAFT_482971 [Mycena pura]|uniref:Uncharacterized protein n=1 Tax=Mycena pura TaxID=153505 RepID=A0AAD6UM54_9AGAR|nr:hypothetical protein GGX14DRAFT_482971 [Mycena pura]
MVGDANNARARPHACTSTSPREIIIPARLCTRMHAPTSAPACTYRRRATNVYAPARTAAAAPAPARTCLHSPSRTYPPPALLYGEAHDPRVGFSTHAPAPTAAPSPACLPPTIPHAGADTSTGASARRARMRRSLHARPARPARWRWHQHARPPSHDPHAGAGTSTGACAPVCAARPPLRTRAARTHISVHGATARIMAELARGRWHAQSGRERDAVPNMVREQAAARGGSERRRARWQRTARMRPGRDRGRRWARFYTIFSYVICLFGVESGLPGMIPRLAQLKIFKYEAGAPAFSAEGVSR